MTDEITDFGKEQVDYLMNKNFKETEEHISLHGLGFIQIKLPDGRRMHVWHPELPKRRCLPASAPHSHRFSFKSTIIIGEITNVEYTRTQVSAIPGNTTFGRSGLGGLYDEYLHEGERSPRGNGPWAIQAEQVYLKELRRSKHTAIYFCCAHEVHATEFDKPCIAITGKTRVTDKGDSSFCPPNILPDDDFNRYQLSVGELWAFVHDALGA